MRVLFADPKSHPESAQKAAKIAAIEAFWRAFTARSAETIAARHARRRDETLAPFMEQHLGAIDPDVIWEIAPPMRRGDARLTLSPGPARHLSPLISELLARAPELPEWEVFPFAVAEDLRAVAHTVQRLANAELLKFEVVVSRAEFNYLAIEWRAPPDVRERLALQAAIEATRGILGEDVMDTWVGALRVRSTTDSRGSLAAAKAKKAPVATMKSAETLARRVMDAISFIDEDLPGEALGAAERKPFCAQQTDDEANGYAARRDLTAATTHPAVVAWHETESSMPFYSRRHSKHGESFCYLKMERGDAPARGPTLAAEMANRLKESADARVIGHGQGGRHDYIDFVARDVVEGARAIQAAAREAATPTRSWVLFFDDTLRDEWLGVYDETEAPPA